MLSGEQWNLLLPGFLSVLGANEAHQAPLPATLFESQGR